MTARLEWTSSIYYYVTLEVIHLSDKTWYCCQIHGILIIASWLTQKTFTLITNISWENKMANKLDDKRDVAVFTTA